jgi:TolB protein
VRPTCEECDARLWTVRFDGSGDRRVPGRHGALTDPSWSPGGRSLAVVRVGAGLYSIGRRDGRRRDLAPRAVVEDPDWSPGGGSIVFARRLGATNWDLYAIRPNGSGLRPLTRTSSQELAPAWSPDGRRIAFQRQDPGGAWSVYVMRADGRGIRRLIRGNTRRSAEQPDWSPDGRRLAYVAVTFRGSYIEVMPSGGGAARRLTGPELLAAEPSWAVGGRRIVFSARRFD